MNCACMIVVIWEGEIPMKCVWSQITLPLSCHCCARDVGPDRRGWKMWSLFPSSSFSSSSPTTSLKIAGRKRRQQSLGSICWAGSGFNTPTSSTRGKRVLWITPPILILIASNAYCLILCFLSRNYFIFNWFKVNLILEFHHFRGQLIS